MGWERKEHETVHAHSPVPSVLSSPAIFSGVQLAFRGKVKGHLHTTSGTSVSETFVWPRTSGAANSAAA